MSNIEEHASLLANAEETPELDDEQAIAMQQMMGFTAFGGPQKPKRQPRGPGHGNGNGFNFGTGANSQPLQPRTPSTSISTSTTLSAASHPFFPASLPPPRRSGQGSNGPVPPLNTSAVRHHNSQFDSPASTATLSPNAVQFAPDHNLQSPHQADSIHESTHDEVAYVNPITGFKFTQNELFAYERGVTEQVTNNDGTVSQVKVYFKPNFIEDDPWTGLEAKTTGGPSRR